MQAHERVEDEQPWLQPGDGLIETGAVGVEIEAQAGGGDHLDVEFGKSWRRRRHRCLRGGDGRMCRASSAG